MNWIDMVYARDMSQNLCLSNDSIRYNRDGCL